MKPLVLALTVALVATLLDLGSAETDQPTEVVKSYEGYDKRRFSSIPTLACVSTKGWENLAGAEAILQKVASGNNDNRQTIQLGTAAIIVQTKSEGNVKSAKIVLYCKYAVSDDDERSTILTVNGKERLFVYKPRIYGFYAKKAADNSPEAIKATAAEVLAALATQQIPNNSYHKNSIMVEVTASNEVFVGPMVAKPSAKAANAAKAAKASKAAKAAKDAKAAGKAAKKGKSRNKP